MTTEHEEQILLSLRKITRAIDLYSHKLARECKMTGPQIVCLRQLVKEETSTPSELAKSMHLSPATVTGILDRLDARGMIVRERSNKDRRRVIVALSENGRELATTAPLPLQERFASKLSTLPEENQTVISTILQQIVSMMEAENLEAAPVLQAGSILDGPTEPA